MSAKKSTKSKAPAERATKGPKQAPAKAKKGRPQPALRMYCTGRQTSSATSWPRSALAAAMILACNCCGTSS